ncbi:oxidoreductase [soil metagenome]
MQPLSQNWERGLGGEGVKQIQVGLIGYGLAGATFHAPIIAAVPSLVLRRVVSSRTAEVARDHPGAEAVSDAEALFADPQIELVVIATPNPTHHPLARRALEAGKHVVVEKPFVVHLAEADELLRLAAEQGRVLSVYHNRRWDGDFQTVKQLIGSGILGRVATYESRFDRYRPQVRDRWRERDEPGSGALYDLGSHLIDQALHLFGLPETVLADVGAQRTGAQTDDYFHLLLGYGKQRVILHSAALVRQPAFRFAIHGDRGSFLKRGLDPQEEQLKQGVRPGDANWGIEPPTQRGELVTEVTGLPVHARVETLPGSYETFYQGIAGAILEGAPAPVSAAEARNTIAVIEAALQSSREGRIVPLSSVPG